MLDERIEVAIVVQQHVAVADAAGRDGDRAEYDRHVATARADDAAFERAWQKGRAMSLEQLADFALQERGTIS